VVVSAANLEIDMAAVRLARDARVLLLQNEVPAAANVHAAREARARAATVVLNAAPWRPLDADLRGLVDVLVLNRVEARAMLGADDVPDEALAPRVAAALPGAHVVVTLGAGGAWLAAPGAAAAHEPAPSVRVTSTHGAGDTFVGALGAGLAAGTPLAAAVGPACRAAARHVSAAAP